MQAITIVFLGFSDAHCMKNDIDKSMVPPPPLESKG